MKTCVRILMVLLLAVGAAGCSRKPKTYGSQTPPHPGRLLEIKPPSRDFASYKELEITDFENALPGVIPQGLAPDLSGVIALRAKLLDRFQAVRQVASAEASPDSGDRTTMILAGRFVDIDTARSNTGFGSRAPIDFLTAEVTLTDKTTGQIISRLMATGYAPSSLPEDEKDAALTESLSETILHYIIARRP